MRRTATVALAVALATSVVTAGAASAQGKPSSQGAPRDVMFVGNNWDGTATRRRRPHAQDDPDAGRDPGPDRADDRDPRDPDKLAFYLAVQQGVGEGHDQYTDDMFTTHDGTLVAVSRPSFADVVGIDLATGAIVWRFPDGGLPGRPHGRLPRRHAAAGQRLDRRQGARARPPHRREAARVRQRRHPAREQLHAGRPADLPRLHRHGLHARPTSSALDTPRASGCSRSCATATCQSSRAGTWARSWPRPATRT